MASFVFPTARDDEQADELWRATRTYATDRTRYVLAETRIRVLVWKHGDRTYRAVVGRRFRPTGDVVMAFFESAEHYLVCPASRGFLRSTPVLADRDMIGTIELFDSPAGS